MTDDDQRGVSGNSLAGPGAAARRRGRPLNAKLIIIPHDGGTNPRNPYDSLFPEERHEKIVRLCARIYLRMRSEMKREG